MVSKNPNLADGFYLDPTGMALSGLGPFATTDSATSRVSSSDDPNKKTRKPYTKTKSRESWTEPEHDKFLEAFQLFDRDWKRIEAFIGSKTAIQKYFLKVQKNGTNEHLPPPRPKRKAAHPYPQKASKNAHAQPQVSGSFQSSTALADTGCVLRSDPSLMLMDPITTAAASSWANNEQTICFSQAKKVLPDFAQVYGFIGSVFDPNTTGHLQKLKKMDPIDIETVLLLMRNLSINLTSLDFEDHRKLLSSYEIEAETSYHGGACKAVGT